MQLIRFNRWLAALYLLLLLLMVASFMWVSHLAGRQQQAAERQVYATEQAQRFVTATAGLTRDVRAFVVTGDTAFENAYQDELKLYRNRHHAAQALRDMGLLPEELGHIDTAETTTSRAYDKLTVQVLNSSGTVLKTLATYSNLNKAAGYAERSFDLSAYRGQTVRLSFKATEDTSLQTSFVLDQVSLALR